MRDEPQFAPVGRYNLGFDENGKLIIYPTYKASRTVNVGPSEEYINPEFIVYPHTVKQLVDDKGKPAFSTDTYNIVHTEKHKPLNLYQGYLESKGVAPKDVQVEHLMLRQRANDAAERSNLSPFFANLMTGMYATAALEGWNNIKNGNYFTGAAEVLSPLMFGENAWNKVAQGAYGGIQLLNENGVPKTWKEIKKGNYGRAVLSASRDLFNLTLAGIGGNLIYRSLGRLNSPKVTIGPIRGIEGHLQGDDAVANVIAREYLLFGGLKAIKSTNYLIKGIQGAFPKVNLSNILKNHNNEIINNGSLSEFKNTGRFKNLMNEILSEIEKVYGKLGFDAFNIIKTNPEGLPYKLGKNWELMYNDMIPLSLRDNLRVNDIKYFTGPSGQLAPRPVNYLSVDPRENPLIARMSRLAEKEKVGDVYPNQKTIYSLTVNPRRLRKTIKEISPDLTENQLDLAVQIVMANRRGSHLSFGNNAGETTGGISVVDVEEAIKYLKEKGIANPTLKDLNIMVGHEKGHGVKLTKEALDAVKGFENPEEFYTLFGQVLDDAGITSTKQMPLQFDLLLKLGDNYLKKGNLDNGVRDAINFLKRFKGDTPMDKVKQRKIMSLINRFSIGTFGIYTIPKLLSDNGKIL